MPRSKSKREFTVREAGFKADVGKTRGKNSESKNGAKNQENSPKLERALDIY